MRRLAFVFGQDALWNINFAAAALLISCEFFWPKRSCWPSFAASFRFQHTFRLLSTRFLREEWGGFEVSEAMLCLRLKAERRQSSFREAKNAKSRYYSNRKRRHQYFCPKSTQHPLCGFLLGRSD